MRPSPSRQLSRGRAQDEANAVVRFRNGEGQKWGERTGTYENGTRWGEKWLHKHDGYGMQAA